MVEFVSYTGKYPNLCSGILALRIDGEDVNFGYVPINPNDRIYKDPLYKPFWLTGGGLVGYEGVYHGEWKVDESDLPEQYRKYAKEIAEVMNANVPYGCCGGCI